MTYKCRNENKTKESAKTFHLSFMGTPCECLFIKLENLINLALNQLHLHVGIFFVALLSGIMELTAI